MLTFVLLVYIVGALGAAVARHEVMLTRAEYDHWSTWQYFLRAGLEATYWPGTVLLRGKSYLAFVLLGVASTLFELASITKLSAKML